MFNLLSKSLLSLVFPSACESCKRLLPLKNELGVCESCQQSIRLIPSPFCPKCGRSSLESTQNCAGCREDRFDFDRVFSAAYYEGPIKKVLCAFKFEKRRFLSKVLMKIIQAYFLENNTPFSWDWVVPVPMPRNRKLERGFNQSELLAKKVSKLVGAPCQNRILGSKITREPQSKLGKKERKQNVRNSFCLKKNPDLKNKKILLVDDILTTGETASQCAKILKQAGAATVDVLVAARGL